MVIFILRKHHWLFDWWQGSSKNEKYHCPFRIWGSLHNVLLSTQWHVLSFPFCHCKTSLQFHMVDEEREKEKPSLLQLNFYSKHSRVNSVCMYWHAQFFQSVCRSALQGLQVHSRNKVSRSRLWFWRQQLLIIPMTFLTFFSLYLI